MCVQINFILSCAYARLAPIIYLLFIYER